MSRRTNILLLLALTSGLAYGYFGVPFLLPLVSDGIEETVEEPPGQVFSEADEIHLRLLSLKGGMTSDEVEKWLGLNKKHLVWFDSWTDYCQIDQGHVVVLRYRFFLGALGLSTAELHNRDRLVAYRAAAVDTLPALSTASVWYIWDMLRPGGGLQSGVVTMF
jgi:hypothetical protein